MKRKDFIKRSVMGLGTIISIPTALTACSEDELNDMTGSSDDSGTITDADYTSETAGDCVLSPSETAGPFPIKTPADLVRSSIISDRTGIALLINLTVQDQSDDCAALGGVYVDLWHCDAEGNYSEYDATGMQQTNYTSKHFLRGRQMTDANGQVSFISIYPGWYSGRAPHIHIEILDANEKSIRVSQIAFPEDISETVYATSEYNGSADTSNTRDNVFSDSLAYNMADSITGNTTNGYTLTKTIVV